MGTGERGTRVELGVVGIGKRVGTRLRRRRGCEEEGESERGKIRPTDVGGYSLGTRISCAHRRKEKATARW
jgi:hypothetical protein